MFKYKTSAELEKMTDDQRDTYTEQKKIHEDAELAKSVDEKVSAKVAEIKADLEKGFISKEEAEKAVTEATKELSETLKKQGEEITALKSAKGEAAKESLLDAFKAQYDELGASESNDYSIKGMGQIKIDVSKVTISTDVLSTETVGSGTFPAAGSTGAMNANIRTLMAQNIGFASYRKPYSPIMEVVDIMPLDSGNLIVLNETVTGDAAITVECALKPIVKVTYADQQVSANPVAAEWATTTKLRRFYPMIANRIERKIAELVMDKVPATVLSAVVSGATAFTSNAALAINDNPNNYDALGAVIAQIQNLGFVPNAIILNPIDYRNMVQQKESDGHYSLWNGNAISLIGGVGLEWNGNIIRWLLDPTLTVDNFIVGDFMETVKVGLDNELLYFETDGRTDAVATNAASGLSRNVRTHVLERFVATIIPTATNIGLVKDTFANVKTLITAA